MHINPLKYVIPRRVLFFLALWAKNSHLAGPYGPAKILMRPKAAQEHELALWAS